MREYDVYLNGVGYMLQKDKDGRLMSGSSRVQKTDPFTRYTSEHERWKRRSFRFSEGSGALVDDGGKRYGHGYDVDSRSGDLLRGPRQHSTKIGWLTDHSVFDGADADYVQDHTLSPAGGAHEARIAFRVEFGVIDHDVRYIHVLVKRHPNVEYTGAANFDVELWSDLAGVPNALVAGCTAAMSPVATPMHWLPHENLWLEHRYFWLECDFGAYVNCPIAHYWIVIRNEAANNPPIDWAYNDHTAGYSVATWTGAAWVVDNDTYMIWCSIHDVDDIDAFPRSMATYRGVSTGADTTRRFYASVGAKLMFWNDVAGAAGEFHALRWDFAAPVLDLLDFNDYLFVATGAAVAGPPEGGLHYYDGDHVTTPGPPPGLWVAVNGAGGEAAYCLALHDNMIWKAEGIHGSQIIGSLTGGVGGGGWASTPHTVGDPRTPISRLISHGGKLYAAKPEGVFEITYPDNYPGVGIEATANLVHDFRTDRTGRNFLVDWHSALYFPGSGGIYEWKSGVLRDLWQERFTADEDQSPLWPVFDVDKGYFRMATATTRGLILGSYSPYLPDAAVTPHNRRGQVWLYDGHWFHPLMLERWCSEPIFCALMEDRGEGYGWLWWGSGRDIWHTEWPNWTQDRSADDRCAFSGAMGGVEQPGHFTLPEFDDDRPDMLKDWQEVQVRSRAMGTGAAEGGFLGLVAYFDNVGPVPIGDITDSPMQIVAFGTGTVSYEIRIEGDFWIPFPMFIPNDTPRVHSIDLVYQPLPDTITQHQVWIKATKGLSRHRAGPDDRGAAEQYTVLAALLELDEPFTFEDELALTHCVRAVGVTKDSVQLVEGPSDEGTGLQVSTVVLVTMLEVSAVCPS